MAKTKRLCRLSTREQNPTPVHGNFHSAAAYAKAKRRRKLQKLGRKNARRG